MLKRRMQDFPRDSTLKQACASPLWSRDNLRLRSRFVTGWMESRSLIRRPSRAIKLRSIERSHSHCSTRSDPTFFWRGRANSRQVKRAQPVTNHLCYRKPHQSFTFSFMPLALLSVFIVFPMLGRLVTPALPLSFPREVVLYKDIPQIFIDPRQS